MNISEKEQKKLFNWNLIMGLLHLIQGAIMVLVTRKDIRSFDFTFNLPQVKFLQPIVVGQPQRPLIEYVPEQAFSINLAYMIAGFLFLSAIAHFITIAPKVFPWYIKNLSNKINMIRWFEYALSSSVMIVVIAALCNIKDASIIILLFVVNACMNLFGAMMEKQNSERQLHAKNYEEISMQMKNGSIEITDTIKTDYKVDWSAFVYGCIAGATPWIVMGIYFFVSISRLRDIEGIPAQVKDVLNLVQFIFPVLFVFFNLFAINMFLQYKGVGKWKDYLWGEKMYILLSLVAKSFLAWFIWGGTLRP